MTVTLSSIVRGKIYLVESKSAFEQLPALPCCVVYVRAIPEDKRPLVMPSPEDVSDIHCFVSDTRNKSPVHGIPGDLDSERLERESLSLDESDSKVDAMSELPQQMLRKKTCLFPRVQLEG